MLTYAYSDPAGYALFRDLMLSESPVWVSRFGGSDTNFVQKWDGSMDSYLLKMLKQYNGYYDFDESKELLYRFSEMYTSSLRCSDLCLIPPSVREYRVIEGDSRSQMKLTEDYGISRAMCWWFVESPSTFLRSFQAWGEGKKILIVSPFSESIKFQTQESRVHKIHKAPYTLPSCEFLTVNSLVTYSLEDWICESVDSERNWFDSAESLFKSVSSLDFDVAFLACGSYAMYLGEKIKASLGKKSIYIGGTLSNLFGLYNDRYSATGHDLSVVDSNFRSTPLENSKYLSSLKNGPDFWQSEGLRAYFKSDPE